MIWKFGTPSNGAQGAKWETLDPTPRLGAQATEPRGAKGGCVAQIPNEPMEGQGSPEARGDQKGPKTKKNKELSTKTFKTQFKK